MPKNEQKTVQRKNFVELVGKLADLKIRFGTKANPRAEKLSVTGSVQIGDDPSFKVAFRTLYPIAKNRKDGAPRKDYAAFAPLETSLRSIAQVGQQDASYVRVKGRIATNIWCNQQGDLIEAPVIEPSSIVLARETDPSYARITMEAMIRRIRPEGSKDEGETGRLKVEVATINGLGTAVPLQFIVPEDMKETFEDAYEEKQTATFNIEYALRIIEPTSNAGGIGVMWTNGQTRLERVLVAANRPVDEDNKRAISIDEMKAALEKYKQHIADVQAYAESRQAKPASATAATGTVDPSNNYANDDELPF